MVNKSPFSDNRQTINEHNRGGYDRHIVNITWVEVPRGGEHSWNSRSGRCNPQIDGPLKLKIAQPTLPYIWRRNWGVAGKMTLNSQLCRIADLLIWLPNVTVIEGYTYEKLIVPVLLNILHTKNTMKNRMQGVRRSWDTFNYSSSLSSQSFK